MKRSEPACGSARRGAREDAERPPCGAVQRSIDSAASSAKASSNCASDCLMRMLDELPVGFEASARRSRIRNNALME